MRYEVILTPDAERDIEETYIYIAGESQMPRRRGTTVASTRSALWAESHDGQGVRPRRLSLVLISGSGSTALIGSSSWSASAGCRCCMSDMRADRRSGSRVKGTSSRASGLADLALLPFIRING